MHVLMNSWKKSIDGVAGFLFPTRVFLSAARNLVLLSFLDPSLGCSGLGVSGEWPGRSCSGVRRQRRPCGKVEV